MLRILARKSALFAEYVRPSTMKDAAPESTDTTDGDRGKAVSVVEHQRRIIEMERRRLGLNTQVIK